MLDSFTSVAFLTPQGRLTFGGGDPDGFSDRLEDEATEALLPRPVEFPSVGPLPILAPVPVRITVELLENETL